MNTKKYLYIFTYFLITNLCLLICVQLTYGSKSDNDETHLELSRSEIFDKGTSEIAVFTFPTTEQPSKVRLYLPDKEETVVIDTEEYVVGVLTAEMYSDAPIEALKAMAVAARTYTLYMCEENKNKEYDIIADHNYSQAYMDVNEAVEVWNELGMQKYNTMKHAVDATSGEVLFYDNSLICALYHASSYPNTENCENVFIEELPYLKGKSNIETLENTYRSTATYTIDEFNSQLALNVYPVINSNDLEIINIKNSNGRCEYLYVKDNNVSFAISGKKVRSVFSLRSTSFDVCINDDIIKFDVYGYGHGVGLSQNGAVLMAKSGKDYMKILSEYYPDTDIYKTIYK